MVDDVMWCCYCVLLLMQTSGSIQVEPGLIIEWRLSHSLH